MQPGWPWRGGDHAGWVFFSPLCVSCCGARPSANISHNCVLALFVSIEWCVTVHTACVPSGDAATLPTRAMAHSSSTVMGFALGGFFLRGVGMPTRSGDLQCAAVCRRPASRPHIAPTPGTFPSRASSRSWWNAPCRQHNTLETACTTQNIAQNTTRSAVAFCFLAWGPPHSALCRQRPRRPWAPATNTTCC